MRLLITIFMVLLIGACADDASDAEEATNGDTQTSQEDVALPNDDVEASEVETGDTTSTDVTPTGDTTPETDVPEGE